MAEGRLLRGSNSVGHLRWSAGDNGLATVTIDAAVRSRPWFAKIPLHGVLPSERPSWTAQPKREIIRAMAVCYRSLQT